MRQHAMDLKVAAQRAAVAGSVRERYAGAGSSSRSPTAGAGGSHGEGGGAGSFRMPDA